MSGTGVFDDLELPDLAELDERDNSAPRQAAIARPPQLQPPRPIAPPTTSNQPSVALQPRPAALPAALPARPFVPPPLPPEGPAPRIVIVGGANAPPPRHAIQPLPAIPGFVRDAPPPRPTGQAGGALTYGGGPGPAKRGGPGGSQGGLTAAEAQLTAAASSALADSGLYRPIGPPNPGASLNAGPAGGSSSSYSSSSAAGPSSSAAPGTSASSSSTSASSSAAPVSGSGAGGGSKLLVRTSQRGNPLLSYIRHVVWEWSADISCDYQPFKACAVVYLTLSMYALRPKFPQQRIDEVKRAAVHAGEYSRLLKVLLVVTDVADCEKYMVELNRLAILNDWTLVCAATIEEAARYLETYKAYENKPATAIKERVGDTYFPKVAELLTTIRSINNSDVISLLSNRGTVAEVFLSTATDLQGCAGIGDTKAARLHDTFKKPLLPGGRAMPKRAAQQQQQQAAASSVAAPSSSSASKARAAAPRGAKRTKKVLRPSAAGLDGSGSGEMVEVEVTDDEAEADDGNDVDIDIVHAQEEELDDLVDLVGE